MNRYLKLILSISAIATYLLALRYIAPSEQPYFIFGIGIIGIVAWFMGTVAGLVTALLLIPLTQFVYSNFSVSTSYISFVSAPAYIAIKILTAIFIGFFRKEKDQLSKKNTQLEQDNQLLQNTLSQVQELGGIHNLCGKCKKIQDDNGLWMEIDTYLKEKSKMEFSHCICPECADDFDPAMPNKKANPE